MAARAVGPVRIVIVLPSCQNGASMIERVERIDVQTFVTQSTLEGLTEHVLDRFSRPNEIKLHAAPPRPVVKCRHQPCQFSIGSNRPLQARQAHRKGGFRAVRAGFYVAAVCFSNLTRDK